MYHTEIPVATTQSQEIIDLTSVIAEHVTKSGVAAGTCIVQSLHTTAGIYTNVTEDLQEDILGILATLAPTERSYNHNRYDPNAEAHIKKILTGRTATVMIEDGHLVLGTWEKVQFAEFDGPRRRTVHVFITEA